MKTIFLLTICLALNFGFSSVSAKDTAKTKSKSQEKISIAHVPESSTSTICDGISSAGAWDWTDWEEVVSDCKIYVFRAGLISKK